MFIPKLDEEINSVLGMEDPSSTPERRLLAALLERAILDYVGNDKAEVQAAEEWLFNWESDSNIRGGNNANSFETLRSFSFPWICHYLDLNPFKVASYIKAMPKRGNHRVAPWYFNKDANNGSQPFASIR